MDSHEHLRQMLEQFRKQQLAINDVRGDDNPFKIQPYQRVAGRKSTPTKPENKPKKPKTDPWDMVKGLDEAKRLLKEAIEQAVTHKAMYEYYGKRPPKGILLYGPPGCGKTLLGKAAAQSIASDLDEDEAEDAFIYVKGPELQDKYVGGTEEKIRDLFKKARKFHKKHGRPAIIFLDEADSLLIARNTGMWYLDSQVNQFLTEMDGMDEHAPIVMLATNRHTKLDPAVIREGRVDYKIHVGRPDKATSADILRHNLKNVPLAESTLDDIVKHAVDAVYSESLLMKKIRVDGEKLNFLFSDIINGAMLAQIVEHSKALALRRDIANKKKTGVTPADLSESVTYTYQQNMNLNQDENIALFLESEGFDTK